MNRTQMIEKIAEHTGIEKKTVAGVLGGLNEVVLASVAKGDSVMLPGIAKFTKVKRKARMGRNPATGAPVKIPAKTVAKVTALKLYKDTVLGATPAPKLQKTGVTKPAPKTSTRSTAARSTAAKPAAEKAADKPASTRSTGTRAKAADKPAAAKPAARSTRSTAAKSTEAKAPARSTGRVAAAKSGSASTSAAKPATRSTRSTAAKAPAKPRTSRTKS
jgi:DNA-binding protein HU-beta